MKAICKGGGLFAMKKYIKNKLYAHRVRVKKLWAVCLILIGINNVIVGIGKYFKADSDRK